MKEESLLLRMCLKTHNTKINLQINASKITKNKIYDNDNYD